MLMRTITGADKREEKVLGYREQSEEANNTRGKPARSLMNSRWRLGSPQPGPEKEVKESASPRQKDSIIKSTTASIVPRDETSSDNTRA